MKAKTLPPGFRRVRRNVFIQEFVHDSYKSRGKPVEPTVCPECGALFHEGRWQRLPAPAAARKERCPACHRIHDRFPAGYVMLGGEFLHAHRDEVVHLLRHVESRQNAEHPLQRIMDITNEDGGVTVSTTDPHLARALGEAVHKAYRGKLEFHYNPEQNLLRVHWER
jgi:NMD protein affecting ribosome stability and mRNA decay